MSLPHHPEHGDTPTQASARSRRRAIAIGVGLVVLMAGLHFLRQSL